MSAVQTGQMSPAETGQMSAAETRQMYSIGTRQSPVAIVDIYLVSTCTAIVDIYLVSTADVCPVSAADICPVSTADISISIHHSASAFIQFGMGQPIPASQFSQLAGYFPCTHSVGVSGGDSHPSGLVGFCQAL